MTQHFPLDAAEIHVKWWLDIGGIGVTASTDEAGLPYIGLYPLNWDGQPTGLPCRFQRSRLIADVVIGFNKREPIVAFIDAQITIQGLSLRVELPLKATTQEYPRHLSARWGSEPPLYRMTLYPANSNWIAEPALRE